MTAITDRRRLLLSTGAVVGLGLAPSLNLRAQEVKPTETASSPPPVSAYAGSPLVDQIAISPDGKRIAIVSQKGDEKLLLHSDVSEPTLRTLQIGPAKIWDLFWADNDHVVLVNSQTTALEGYVGAKHEFYLARVIEVNTASVNTLFSDMDGFYNIVRGDLHRIKTADGYRVTASNDRFRDDYPVCLYSFSVDKRRGRLIYEADRYTQSFVLLPDGTPLAYSDFNDDRKTWELYYNTAPAGKSPFFKVIYKVKEALNYPSLEGVGRDGQSVVVYIDKGEAGGQYHEISATGALSEPLETSKTLSATPLFHPTTKRLVGFSYQDDWITYDYTDPVLKQMADALPKIMGKDYRCSFVSFAEDPRKVIVYGESPTDAGSYCYVDFSKGDVVDIASNYGDLPEAWITQKKPIHYKAADGLDIHAYLTLPPFKESKNLPLIVLPHGGPQVRDYINFDWQAQVLASRGYAVLQPNYRGSAGYGDDFVGAGHGEFGRKMQTDLSDGVRDLVRQGLVDPKRVAIFGASYGGYAALAGATLDPGIYTCAVAVAGVTDPKSFIDFVDTNSTAVNSSAVMYWKQFMGDPKSYDEISPAKQAAKASCPILLLHGTDDTVVPISQSQRMEKALKAAGKPVEFITYKGQTHWENIGSLRIEMMNTALAFLTKYNPAA